MLPRWAGHPCFLGKQVIRHIRWQILLVALAIVLVGAFLSYQAVELEEVFVPASGGILIEGVVGWPQHLNPLLSMDNPVDEDITALIFEGLTRYDERGELVPLLATGWHASLDGLVYTFWLRQDIRWQDGISLTADDVLLTFGLLQDESYPGPADLGALWRSVRVDKINRWTVTFTLQEPFAPFVDYTTIGILPAHLLASVEAADLPDHPFSRSPVGTGPFRLVDGDWASGSIELVKNELYREKRPQLAGIEFRFFPDYGSLLAAFEKGDVHTACNIPRTGMTDVQELDGVSLYTSSLPRYTTILLNLQSGTASFLQEREVRQALLSGLDRPSLIAAILDGQGVVAHSPIFPGSWAHLEDILEYDHEPEAAGGLLDGAGWLLPEVASGETDLVESDELQAGVRMRDDEELAISLLVSAGTVHQEIGREIARQWAKLGVRVTVVPVSVKEIAQRLDAGEFESILVDMDMHGDPDPYPYWSESAIQEGQNYGGWRDREASELLEQARQLSNPEQRTILYHRFQQLFAEEVPALLLYFHTYTYGVSDKVQQVSVGPLTTPSDRFATVDVWFLVWREVIVRKTKPRY